MEFKISKSRFKGPFNLKLTLDSDQCPSDIWCLKNGKYTTFIGLKNNWIPITIWEARKNLFFECKKDISEKLLYHFWSDYDLLKFYSEFTSDKYISKAINFCQGLRLMRDWDINYRMTEAILTQNASVKQIRNMEGNLRNFYGNQHTFNLEKIANTDEEEIQKKCKVGYRAKYLINVARKILNNELNIEQIRKMDSSNARKLLTSIDGIGVKVADIILLYGFGKIDTFPMDVWLRRALIREYFKGEQTSDKRLREFALNYFGNHAGIAHLYMFYYERKIKSSQ